MSLFIQHSKKIILQQPGLLKEQNPAQTQDPFLQQVRTCSIMYINEITKCIFLSIATLYTVMIFYYNVDLFIFCLRKPETTTTIQKIILKMYCNINLLYRVVKRSHFYYTDSMVSVRKMSCLIRASGFCSWSRGFFLHK